MSSEAGAGAHQRKLVVVCGKGGVGKTALTAMISRVLTEGRVGGKLLLIDADPAMGLPSALGVTAGRTMGQVREEIIRAARKGSERDKERLADQIDYLSFEALIETDSYALLSMGRTETLGCYCPVNDLLRAAIETLSESFDTIVVDAEAGLEQINRQIVRDVSLLVIVSDATSRGIQTAALIRKMVVGDRVIQCDRMGIVFNKVLGQEALLTASAAELGLDVLACIPYDENVVQYDLVGSPVYELPSDSPSLAAVRNMVKEVLAA